MWRKILGTLTPSVVSLAVVAGGSARADDRTLPFPHGATADGPPTWSGDNYGTATSWFSLDAGIGYINAPECVYDCGYDDADAENWANRGGANLRVRGLFHLNRFVAVPLEVSFASTSTFATGLRLAFGGQTWEVAVTPMIGTISLVDNYLAFGAAVEAWIFPRPSDRRLSVGVVANQLIGSEKSREQWATPALLSVTPSVSYIF